MLLLIHQTILVIFFWLVKRRLPFISSFFILFNAFNFCLACASLIVLLLILLTKLLMSLNFNLLILFLWLSLLLSVVVSIILNSFLSYQSVVFSSFLGLIVSDNSLYTSSDNSSSDSLSDFLSDYFSDSSLNSAVNFSINSSSNSSLWALLHSNFLHKDICQAFL